MSKHHPKPQPAPAPAKMPPCEPDPGPRDRIKPSDDGETATTKMPQIPPDTE